MITISKNVTLDAEVYRDFWDFAVAGADFAAAIKSDHPSVTLENHEQHIADYYRTHEKELDTAVATLQKAVDERQKALFEKLQTVFGVDLSSREIHGYISIFNCNPRFVESQSFQVFYKRPVEEQWAIVAHEVAHFAFFEMCRERLSEETRGLDTNTGPLWELSEIVNCVVSDEKLFYRDHEQKLEAFRKIFEKYEGNIERAAREYLRGESK